MDDAAGRAPSAALLTRLRARVGPPPAGIDPRVLRVDVASRALGVRKSFYVHLPPGYHKRTARYPTLYLLRGHEREWVNPAEDGSRHGTVVDVYLRLLEAGAVGPMILVFPGLTSDDGRIHGVATDFRARALAPDVPGIGTGRFEAYLVHELVPLVDALFRTAPDGRRRGVDGFSLGGLMALMLALRCPDLVATAGAYDGTFLYADATGARIRANDRVFGAPLFDPVFGVPRDHAYAAARNPANLIVRWPPAPPAPPRRLRLFVQYGPRELEPMGSNYYRGAYLCGLLAARGLPNDVAPVIPDGRHDWASADRHLAATLPLHWAVLGA